MFKYGLEEKDLHLTGNGLKNTVNRYLKEKGIDVIGEKFDLSKSLKNLTGNYDKINTTVEEYEPKKNVVMGNKKRVVSILSKFRNNFLDHYL